MVNDATPSNEVRRIRALAHPLRLRILDLLSERGELTATQVSDVVAESPANCSFHLRTLALYGYVEEASGGEGRNRPWRAVHGSVRWDSADADPEAALAMGAADEVMDARAYERLRSWRARASDAPRPWQEGAFTMAFETWLSADELEQVSKEIFALLQRHADADTPREERARVVINASGFPIGEALPVPTGADQGL